ncbi:glycerophosphodiester phosphodiesterase family protein [Prosthecobacter sp.]|uniref:glycerophosphodiester phosphodiesterase family protein n=1 Tax=Prosthecobacter sp. TaxID=1965333 RepID=UPI0037846458
MKTTLYLSSLLLLTSWMAGAQEAATKPLHRIHPQTAQDLQAVLSFKGQHLPFVSAHRGGPTKGFPENCIPTFEHTLQRTFSMLEIDPRRTKDGAIVILHDATLERTTTGKGKVLDFTLEELKKLRLKDTEGQVTAFQMPTLDEVIEWARGKTVLVLDQKDVTPVERAEIVTRHKAEAYVMLIISSFKDAVAVHKVNPDIVMEVMIPTVAKAEEFDQTGIPWRNIIAFVGHTPPQDVALYDFIHRKGASCMAGTSRHLDLKVIRGEVADIQEIEEGYRSFLSLGADIFETDIPVRLGPMLHKDEAALKQPFFELK